VVRIRKPALASIGALLCVLVLAAGGCAEPPSTVAGLLAASSRAYRSAEGYSHRLSWRYVIEIPSEGTSEANSGNHTLAVAPDGRFRFGEFDGVVAYVDGKDMIAHRPYSGNYQAITLASDEPWPEAVPVAGKYIRLLDPASILATGDVADWAAWQLLDMESAELIHDESGGRIGISATVDGSSLLGGPGDRAELWFDAETYLLVAGSVDSQAAFLAARGLPEANESVVMFEFEVTGIRTGPDARLANLEFQPRPQDRRVEQMVPEPGKRAASSVLAFVGQPAPPISAATLDRGRFELASLAGDVVLLDFWASWCGSCLRSKPGMKSIGEDFANEAFTMVSVSLDNEDHRASVERLVVSSGIDAINIMDSENRISTNFRVVVQPTFVLIDADGVVRHVQTGSLVDERLDTLRDEIGRLLAPAERSTALLRPAAYSQAR